MWCELHPHPLIAPHPSPGLTPLLLGLRGQKWKLGNGGWKGTPIQMAAPETVGRAWEKPAWLRETVTLAPGTIHGIFIPFSPCWAVA